MNVNDATRSNPLPDIDIVLSVLPLMTEQLHRQLLRGNLCEMHCATDYVSLLPRGWASAMNILVVDDHALIREALQGVLKKVRRDAVVFEAANCSQAMKTMAEHPDIGLVLLDLTLPDRDGFSVLAELRERHPTTSIVVLSAVQDRINVLHALELGAQGYIPKSAHRDVMISALNLVFSGGVYIPPEILQGGTLVGLAADDNHHRVAPADLGLTDRQLDVLALVMQGKSNKTICRILDLAEPTVKNHMTAILKTLKVSNRTEAVVAATQLGWKLPTPDRS